MTREQIDDILHQLRTSERAGVSTPNSEGSIHAAGCLPAANDIRLGRMVRDTQWPR